MWFQFNCECSSHSRRGPWSVAAAERTYQRLWGECAYPWSPVDSGLCSDTWSRWARLALSPKSAPSLLVRCCHPAGGPPLVSRWRGAQGTPHSINTQAPHGMERGEKKGKRQERKQEIEGKSGGGGGRMVQRKSVSLSQEIRSKGYMNNTSSNFSPNAMAS